MENPDAIEFNGINLSLEDMVNFFTKEKPSYIVGRMFYTCHGHAIYLGLEGGFNGPKILSRYSQLVLGVWNEVSDVQLPIVEGYNPLGTFERYDDSSAVPLFNDAVKEHHDCLPIQLRDLYTASGINLVLRVLKDSVKPEIFSAIKVVSDILQSSVATSKYREAKKIILEQNSPVIEEVIQELDLLGALHASFTTLAYFYYGNVQFPRLRLKLSSIASNLLSLRRWDNVINIDEVRKGIAGVLFNDLRNFDYQAVATCLDLIRKYADPRSPYPIQEPLMNQIKRTFGRIQTLFDFYDDFEGKSAIQMDLYKRRRVLYSQLSDFFRI